MALHNKHLTSLFLRLRDNGTLTLVYALLSEALFFGYLAFIGLFTLETLLPTFIMAHLSLAKFFFSLIIGTFLVSLLGNFLAMRFTWHFTKKSPLLWLATLWAAAILAVSLYKFPPLLIPLLIVGFLIVGYLFGKIIFSEKSSSK